MKHISYKRHRFHPDIIKHAVWLYFRFTLSFRDIECMMAERGIDVSYETLHYWVEKFGLKYASTIRKPRRAVSPHWYLDEVFVSMGKQKYYLWRAVDDEGEVLVIRKLILPRAHGISEDLVGFTPRRCKGCDEHRAVSPVTLRPTVAPSKSLEFQ